MLMFELIWVERGLAFEVEGNNICKSLEPRKDMAILRECKCFCKADKKSMGAYGGVDDNR